MHRSTRDHTSALATLVQGTTAGLSPSQIDELTRYLERRLTDIGDEGDCAYERAMGKVYLQLISALRDARPVSTRPGR